MLSQKVGRIFSWPIRAILKSFGRGVRDGARLLAAETGTGGQSIAGSAARAARKSGGSALAKAAATEILDAEYREEPPSGLEAAMFKQLPRPRLTEKSASDMTIDQAQSYAEQARRFYDFRFPLFPRGDFFYEEIEEEYLHAALGYDDASIDQRFIDVSTLFRRTLNANTRRLLIYWAPVIGLVFFALAALLGSRADMFSAAQFNNPWLEAGSIYGGAALVASFFAFLVYSWPYKVVQQRNLMNLDNYVTSKFARINNNFQVAKRRALNVERDKRMSERNELKDEAGAWTLSYHWFAARLLLCETMLRNKFYQVRRNTTLYWVAGLVLSGLALATIAALLWRRGADTAVLTMFVAAGGVYIIFIGAVLARATAMMFHVLEANEWSRFHLLNLDRTIRDHVGEDKLQIVTFRDRNRFE